MQVEQAFVMDKFRQMRSENDRLKDDLEAFRKQLGSSAERYVSAPPTKHSSTARSGVEVVVVVMEAKGSAPLSRRPWHP
eukprot:365462-Chlamydomonas_euryale.AAC.5